MQIYFNPFIEVLTAVQFLSSKSPVKLGDDADHDLSTGNDHHPCLPLSLK
jgi:hypothetical protein